MTEIPLTSTCFRSLAYDRGGQELHLKFTSGRTQIYFDVPCGTVRRLLRAKSAGRFYAENIRGKFGGPGPGRKKVRT